MCHYSYEMGWSLRCTFSLKYFGRELIVVSCYEVVVVIIVVPVVVVFFIQLSNFRCHLLIIAFIFIVFRNFTEAFRPFSLRKQIMQQYFEALFNEDKNKNFTENVLISFK
jgi:hypothetical protein